MPRPGQLTRSRANRKVRTPGGRLVIHRQKYYNTKAKGAITGAFLRLPKEARQDKNRKSSKSKKRPNRPYGGYATHNAVKRGIIRAVREAVG